MTATYAFAQEAADMGMAREWCDKNMTRGLEGIWEFPDDLTYVLVKRTPAATNSYDIFVVETPDTRLTPGEAIGSIRETPVSDKFEMQLYRNRRKGVLADPGKCLAEYVRSEDAMLVTGRKLKISLASRWFLPSFWRAIRLKVSDPLDKLPYGMRRVYPEKVKRNVDYL